jgi:parvulin-like peptidyl-prolyl isomerase
MDAPRLKMSRSRVWLMMTFIIVISLIVVGSLVWQSKDRDLSQALRDLQFRDPTITADTARQSLKDLEYLRQHRLATPIIADVSAASTSECATWQKQFPLGDAERAQRLDLQQQSETDMRRNIQELQLDQAWLEHQLRENAPPVTEAEAKAWFSQHAKSLCLPAVYRVAHLFLSRHHPKKPDRIAEIRALHQKLISGAMKFESLVSKYSEDSRTQNQGGDLAWISATRMPADFMNAVEKARVGEISAPVETQLGWHILLVSERRESRLPNFEEARAEIISLLEQQRREQAWGGSAFVR